MKLFNGPNVKRNGCTPHPVWHSVLVLALAAVANGAAEAKVFKADFNGDGREDLMVGVPDNSSGGKKNAGSVTIWYGVNDGVLSPDPQ